MLRFLGYRVTPCFVTSQGPRTWYRVGKTLQKGNLVFIRIDGSGMLDTYTLLKIIFPYIRIYWEIHGSLEELLWSGNSNRFGIALKHMCRFMLSWFTSGYIFVSSTLQRHMATHMLPKRSIVLPNFFARARGSANRDIMTSIKKMKSPFIVFWGGDPQYRWQAVDLVDKVAEAIYAVDPHILFIVTGQGSWYKLPLRPNVMILPLVDERTYQTILAASHVCLALYHPYPGVLFYFSPLKIISYLAFGKPVIATNIGEIPQFISDGANGFLTNNSITQIVKFVKILRRKNTLRMQISRAAKQSAERFTMRPMSLIWKSQLASFFPKEDEHASQKHA